MNEQEWLTSDDQGRMLTWLRDHAADPRPANPPRVGGRPLVSDRKLRLFACACARQVWHLLPDGRSRAIVEMTEDEIGGHAYLEARTDAMCAMEEIRGEPVKSPAFAAAYTAWICSCDPDELARYLGLSRSWWLLNELGLLLNSTQAALLREVVGNPWRPVKVGCSRGHKDCSTHKPDWLTPQALSLAQAAYDERPGRVCEACNGQGIYRMPRGEPSQGSDEYSCVPCHGAGRVHDGALDPARLGILADCLEEEGCPLVEQCHACKGAKRVYTSGTPYDSGWESCPVCKYSPGSVPHPLLAHLRSPGPHVRGCFVLDIILGKE